MAHEQWLYDIPFHALGTTLLSGVYRCPRRIDRTYIEEMLRFIEDEYPAEKSEIINPALWRVLEDCFEDTDTWVVERFIAAGANVDQPFCLRKPVWQAGCTGSIGVWEENRSQVVAVLRVLINAGADPDKKWDEELEGRSTREFFADLSSSREGGWDRLNPLSVLEEAEQWKALQVNTGGIHNAVRVRRF